MLKPKNETQVGKLWDFFSTRTKILATLVALLTAGQCFGAVTIHSPRGAELFGSSSTSTSTSTSTSALSSTPIPTKTIQIQWTYPTDRETADMIFKIYHCKNLARPIANWIGFTNIPGNLRSVNLPADKPQEFFIVTVSNFLGEMSLDAPLPKRIQLQWNYPTAAETPDLVFNVYHSTNLAQPTDQWELLTNIRGNLRSAQFYPDKSREFYILTASNYLGESNMATR